MCSRLSLLFTMICAALMFQAAVGADQTEDSKQMFFDAAQVLNQNQFINIPSSFNREPPLNKAANGQKQTALVGVIMLPFDAGVTWHLMMGWLGVKRLLDYLNDPRIDAIMLFITRDIDIDLSYASSFFMELRRAILKKPVVVFIADSCTDGCYYLASGASYIVANSQARLGGIGTNFYIRRYHNLKLNDEKTGDIETMIFYKGKYKVMLEPTASPLSDDERHQIDELIQDQYDQFCSDVAQARTIKLEDASVWADGKLIVGTRAVKVGLIDKIGPLSELFEIIKAEIAQRSGVHDFEIQFVTHALDNDGKVRGITFDYFLELMYNKYVGK